MHFSNSSENSYVDEFTSIIAMLLTTSSVLSFISIRTSNKNREQQLEKYADYIFITSLIGVFGIILFIALNFWKK
jgi:hypothetical protein